MSVFAAIATPGDFITFIMDFQSVSCFGLSTVWTLYLDHFATDRMRLWLYTSVHPVAKWPLQRLAIIRDCFFTHALYDINYDFNLIEHFTTFHGTTCNYNDLDYTTTQRLGSQRNYTTTWTTQLHNDSDHHATTQRLGSLRYTTTCTTNHSAYIDLKFHATTTVFQKKDNQS